MNDAEIKTAFAKMDAKLDDVLRRLAYLGEPDLTVKDFAKRAGRSRTTVHAMVNRFEIVTRNGRVPASELRKFTS